MTGDEKGRPGRVEWRTLGLFYGYGFFDGLILIYPVYLLYFRDQGLSETEIATLLMLWPISSLLFELPSGYLADRFSKKAILIIGHVAYLGCFAVWHFMPTFVGFGIGLALWGMRGALSSGAFRSFLYEEMEARGARGAFVRVLGQINALKWTAMLIAYSVGPALMAFGFTFVLALTAVAAVTALGCLLLVRRKAPTVVDDGTVGLGEFVRALHGHVVRDPAVLRVILFGGALIGTGAVDEYWPLLGTDLGVPETALGLFLGAIMGAQALGDLLAHRLAALKPVSIGATVAGAGVMLLVGVGVGTLYLALPAVVVFAMLYQGAATANSGLLHDRVAGSVRASAASILGFASNIISILLFYAIGQISERAGVPLAIACAGGIFIVIGLAGMRAESTAGRSPGHGGGKDA
ncbi:MFS transporter [Stappia stellulata]|uniref:MFS transporter n=1 Tax=Stappia stellulata TaxID=71235 RepID=UPI0004198E24|nr:MFS transporter [Stappia stellulata]